jgi:hypothetical protein
MAKSEPGEGTCVSKIPTAEETGGLMKGMSISPVLTEFSEERRETFVRLLACSIKSASSY